MEAAACGTGAPPAWIQAHGTAAQEDRPHAHRGGGAHVVVDAIPDVGHGLGRQAQPIGDGREERRVGLGHAQTVTRGDEVQGDADVAEQVFGLSWLVAGDADEIARVVEAAERAEGVAVEVLWPEHIRHAGCRAVAPRRAQVHVRAEDPERLKVVATTLDDRPEHGEERQSLDPKPVGPGRPEPVLVDERLADIEHDGSNPAAQLGGRRQCERSCQLMPPSGAPGSFGCGSPVRLSTCSTPRR